jgi:hypothetical protein
MLRSAERSEVEGFFLRLIAIEDIIIYVTCKRTHRQLNAAAIRNQPLQGDLILEVPVQAKPIPKAVLDAAGERDITIRDVAGKVYGND